MATKSVKTKSAAGKTATAKTLVDKSKEKSTFDMQINMIMGKLGNNLLVFVYRWLAVLDEQSSKQPFDNMTAETASTILLAKSAKPEISKRKFVISKEGRQYLTALFLQFKYELSQIASQDDDPLKRLDNDSISAQILMLGTTLDRKYDGDAFDAFDKATFDEVFSTGVYGDLRAAGKLAPDRAGAITQCFIIFMKRMAVQHACVDWESNGVTIRVANVRGILLNMGVSMDAVEKISIRMLELPKPVPKLTSAAPTVITSANIKIDSDKGTVEIIGDLDDETEIFD